MAGESLHYTDLILYFILAFITMSLGLSLIKDDFQNLFLQPKSLFIGLFAQMVLLPVLAFALMYLTGFSPPLKVGFIIVAICPGGVTANLVCYLLRGNVALSISLTVINGILSLLTIPILTSFALSVFVSNTAQIELPVLNTVLNLSFVSIVPAAVGMGIRHYRPAFAASLKPLLRILLPTLLLFIFGIKFLAPTTQGGVGLTTDEIYALTPIVLLLNAFSMVAAYLAGAFFKVKHINRVTIIIEVGLQNTGLALFIAGTILHSTEMQKPAMVYALITFISTFVFAWIIREFTRPRQSPESGNKG